MSRLIFLFFPFFGMSQTYHITRIESDFAKVYVDGWVQYQDDRIVITVHGSEMVFKITERIYSHDVQGHRVKMDKRVFRILDYPDRVLLEGETVPIKVNYIK